MKFEIENRLNEWWISKINVLFWDHDRFRRVFMCVNDDESEFVCFCSKWVQDPDQINKILLKWTIIAFFYLKNPFSILINVCSIITSTVQKRQRHTHTHTLNHALNTRIHLVNTCMNNLENNVKYFILYFFLISPQRIFQRTSQLKFASHDFPMAKYNVYLFAT